MLCGIFDVERDNCWKVWNGMPCAFIALGDGMERIARALPKARWKAKAHGFSVDVVVVALVSHDVAAQQLVPTYDISRGRSLGLCFDSSFQACSWDPC